MCVLWGEIGRKSYNIVVKSIDIMVNSFNIRGEYMDIMVELPRYFRKTAGFSSFCCPKNRLQHMKFFVQVLGVL